MLFTVTVLVGRLLSTFKQGGDVMDFKIGEVVSCKGMPASIEDVMVLDGAVLYFVKSFWFDTWVHQTELKRY